MCARRAVRPDDLEPENAPPIVVQPVSGDTLPIGMEDREPDDAGADDFGDLFALSDEAYRDALWYVWRRRVPGAPVERGTSSTPQYVTKLVGPIDLDSIAKQIGGGSFRLCGYRNGRKFIERPLEIDGPRKSHEPEKPAPASAPTAAAGLSAQDVAAIVSAAIERVFARIEQKLTPPPAPAAMGIKDVIEVAKMMRPESAQASPDANVVQSMIGMLKQGIELGATREPGGGTDWAAVIEKAMPLADRFISAIAQRRGVPQRRPAPQGQPVPPSRAEVIPDQPTPAAPVEPVGDEADESVRMAAVVEALARAIDAMGTEGEIEPADFAATAETILLPAELSMLRMTTTDGLMSELSGVSDRFPVFSKPQARAFVDAVLSELRSPTA